MLNLAFPLLNGIDAWLGEFLPLVFRVWVWGFLAGAAAIGLYALASNQPAIRLLKDEARGLRRRMLDPGLAEDDFRAVSKRNLRVSFTLLGRVFGPALISALPILLLAAWLDTYHGYALPAGSQPVRVQVSPAGVAIEVRPETAFRRTSDGGFALMPTEMVTLTAGNSGVYSGNLFQPPAAGVGKRQWWNILLAGENGYLDAASPVDEIRLGFAPVHLVSGLPQWAAGWEMSYFLAALLAALAAKLVFRVA